MATFRFPALVAGLLSLSACVGVQPSFNPEERQVFDEAVADDVPVDVADEPIALQSEAGWTTTRQVSWSSTDRHFAGRDFRRRAVGPIDPATAFSGASARRAGLPLRSHQPSQNDRIVNRRE